MKFMSTKQEVVMWHIHLSGIELDAARNFVIQAHSDDPQAIIIGTPLSRILPTPKK